MTKDTLFFENEDIYFIADTHWGHRNIIDYCQRPFTRIEEMDEALIANWNKVVGKDDIIFHLGDFAMGGPTGWNRLLDRLNGRIYLIMGNHDYKTISKGVDRFEDVSMQMIINVKGQKIYLNHYPFLCYSGAYRNTWQLFGHVHTCNACSSTDSPRLKMLLPMQYDVGVDNNSFTPVSFAQVSTIIRRQIDIYSINIEKNT